METPSYSEWADSEYSRDPEASGFSLCGRRILCLTDHTRQIQHIYDNTLEEYPGVGILTASNRDVWSKVSTIRLSYSLHIQGRGSPFFRII
jgi:hypothetical protein